MNVLFINNDGTAMNSSYDSDPEYIYSHNYKIRSTDSFLFLSDKSKLFYFISVLLFLFISKGDRQWGQLMGIGKLLSIPISFIHFQFGKEITKKEQIKVYLSILLDFFSIQSASPQPRGQSSAECTTTNTSNRDSANGQRAHPQLPRRGWGCECWIEQMSFLFHSVFFLFLVPFSFLSFFYSFRSRVHTSGRK